MMMLIFILQILKYIILVLLLMLGVAFFTFFERSVLGYIQIRKGPNKVGFLGIMQPVVDGVKLFIKENIYTTFTNNMLFFLSPIYGLVMAFVLASIYSGCGLMENSKWVILFFMCVSSVSVYSIIMGGWSSMSKYSNLGGYRSVAQTISYEVSMSFILLVFIYYYESYSFSMFIYMNYFFLLLSLPVLLIWLGIIVAETNRSPFDLSEAESELVSGFNTEYSGGGFALIFIAEYMNIIMMCVLSLILISSFNIFLLILMMGGFLWLRGSFPRVRYDSLMYLAWKMYLPIVLGFVSFVMGIFFCYL